MRLIKADALIQSPGKKHEHWHELVPGENKEIEVAHSYALNVIRNAPTISEDWIPCSERLPKRDELVLVTYKTTDRIHLCRYIDDGSENPWWSYIDDCCAWNNVVLAWMPLPEAYKGGDDE